MRKRTLAPCFVLAIGLAVSCQAQQPFDSPEAAAQGLVEATDGHDAARLASILGPMGRGVQTSGNAEEDRAEQSEFVRLYRSKHQLEPDPRDPNRVILAIGDADWPFPMPIVRRNGKWSFDASDAAVEMQARRIGGDELDAIEICAGYVEAQRKYASEDHEKTGMRAYASRVTSTLGKHDGLYWEGAGNPLVTRGFAEAEWETHKANAKPYHGYYFRILTGQGPAARGGAHNYRVKDTLMGGFGLVAWPAQYGVSGINTFIVNQNGVIYQKDITPVPAGSPSPVKIFDPDASWAPVD
jgi:Protein of unknown function (DUF2950)